MATTSEAELRSEARGWLEANWDPSLTVRRWWRLLAESGWAYPTWPSAWYGRDLDADAARVVRSEMQRVGALPPPHGIGQTMGAPVLLQFGTDEQRQRLLPAIATGEEAWCQFFSEPDAGSDLAAVTTRAVPDGDEWIVNGQKVWNSGTVTSDRGLLVLRTNPEVPKHRGLSFFIIDIDQPGIEIRPILQLNGDSEFNETFFTDARARADDLIGGLDNGWAVTLATLANERSSYAAGADFVISVPPGEKSGLLDVACAEAFDLAKKLQETVSSFPVGDAMALADVAREVGRLDDPAIRQRIATIHSMNEVARLTAMRAKAAAESGRQPGPESSIGYVAGVNIARATRDLGLALLGADGMLTGADAPHDGAIAMMALTSLAHGIAGGSEQIQRNIIGERVLGLPREPQVDRDVPFSEVLTTRKGSTPPAP